MQGKSVRDLFEGFGAKLDLELAAGQKGLGRKIARPDVCRPGLSLAGFQEEVLDSLLVLGPSEVSYMLQLSPSVRMQRWDRMLTPKTPLMIITKKYCPTKEEIGLCNQKNIPLFLSSCPTTELISRLIHILEDFFAPETMVPGTMVEVFGVGLLIQGESFVGKSESALGLLERGHRLIADDIVKIQRKGWKYLVGSGEELGRYHMNIRNVGVINVSHLFGALCVRSSKRIDLIVQLEEWKEAFDQDPMGLGEKFFELLGIKLPFHILPVKLGRDVALLLETLALNYRLKERGEHSAREFHKKLLGSISQKNRKIGLS